MAQITAVVEVDAQIYQSTSKKGSVILKSSFVIIEISIIFYDNGRNLSLVISFLINHCY